MHCQPRKSVQLSLKLSKVRVVSFNSCFWHSGLFTPIHQGCLVKRKREFHTTIKTGFYLKTAFPVFVLAYLSLILSCPMHSEQHWNPAFLDHSFESNWIVRAGDWVISFALAMMKQSHLPFPGRSPAVGYCGCRN